MKKEIKRIIGITLVISAFTMIEPTRYMNITNTVTAHAEVVGAKLKDLSVEKGHIDFDSDITSYTVTLDSSEDEIKIKAKPRDEDAEVKIDGSEVTESDSYKRTVKLEKGENIINVKVKNGTRNKTYTITVIRGEIEAEKQIYLKNIILNSGIINFSKEKTSYDVNVGAEVNDISIKSIPEDTEYIVEINGFTAREEDDYKRTFTLNNGKNEIKIEIQDEDDNKNVYTLNINKGDVTAQANSQTTNSNPASTVKGWVLNDGKWYYFNEDGNKQIGWKQVAGSWYYLDSSGIMKTGWQAINNDWYYLDSNGKMKTGWLVDSDGKWYYLYNSGAMAKNTTINGYKINSSGNWN